MTKTKNKFLVLACFAFIACFALIFAGCDMAPRNNEQEQDLPMTQSYRTARLQFCSVTGINLPALDNLNVEAYPYQAGDQEYCFDITSGSALNYSTYLLFESFFETTLGNCDEGYPNGNEANGRDAEWTVNGRWYQTIWDADNTAIYINTTLREEPQMTEMYAQGRQTLHDITGYWLPELYDVGVEYSSFDANNKTGLFNFWADSTLYGTVVNYLKELFPAEPLTEENDSATWEFDATVNENDARYNIEVNFVVITGSSYISIRFQVRDFYDIALDTTVGGSVTLQMGTQTFGSNTASVLAGDNLILTATPDSNYNFVGWYVGNTFISSLNPYTYIMTAQDVTIQGKFEVKPVQMTQSYSEGKNVFESATGVSLPVIANLEATIGFGSSYVMFDIVSGENLTQETYNSILAFLDDLDGWAGIDATQDEAYPTKQYTNSTSGVVFQAVWDNLTSTHGIYLNVLTALASFNSCERAIIYLEDARGISFPEMPASVLAEFSCNEDFSEITFDLTSQEANFTEIDYNQMVQVVAEFVGDAGNDESEAEVNMKNGWVVDGTAYLSVEWDLATGISFNVSKISE